MLRQVLEGALAREHSLCTIPKHGKHGQAAIAKLLGLELLELCLCLAQVKQVEKGAAWVCGVAAAVECSLKAQEVLLALAAWETVILQTLELCKLHQDDLYEKQAVRVCPVACLIGASGGEDTRSVPDDVLGGLGDGTCRCQHLGGDAAGSAEHGPATVDHLAVGQPVGVDEATCTLRVGQALL